MHYYLEVLLNFHALLYESTLGYSFAIIWRYPWVLISYYMRVSIGQQRDVTILILPIPIPFCISGIDTSERNINFENFEKPMLDSNSSTRKPLFKFYIAPLFSKKEALP